jgi:hypothetical protein
VSFRKEAAFNQCGFSLADINGSDSFLPSGGALYEAIEYGSILLSRVESGIGKNVVGLLLKRVGQGCGCQQLSLMESVLAEVVHKQTVEKAPFLDDFISAR